MRVRKVVALLLSATGSLSFAAGCKSSAKQSLTDSEARRYWALCEPASACRVSAATSTSSGDASVPLALLRTGRVVGVCELPAEGAAPVAANCRPLICEGDADCPPAEGLNHGVCINRLCTEPSHAVTTEDAIQLCLAGTGRGEATPLQVERRALGLNCGTPCQIPKPCRQL